MRILISGLKGHMGQIVAEMIAREPGKFELASGVDITADGSESVPCFRSFAEAEANVDCIIDFSHHSCTEQLTAFAAQHRIPLVIATTGQTAEERQMISEAATKTPVFFAANFSMGIAILVELAKKTAALMPGAEIEIIEKHHDRKADAPSGTALAIANAICRVRPSANVVCGRSGMGVRTKDEIGISSVRMGNIVGEHEVIIGTDSQTITLKHEAHSRALFAEGALAAAGFIVGQEPGLYDMTSMVQM